MANDHPTEPVPPDRQAHRLVVELVVFHDSDPRLLADLAEAHAAAAVRQAGAHVEDQHSVFTPVLGDRA